MDKNNTGKHFALVLDCDETIAKDTTSQLIDLIGGNSVEFWAEINPRYSEGWDASLLWMPELLKYASKIGRPLTKELLSSIGAKIEFFEGVPEVFKELKDWFREKTEKSDQPYSLKIFIVTGALEELLLRTKIQSEVDEIYGCTYFYNSSGEAISPMSSVTFTEKTRYLFSINKGISKSEERNDANLVNKYMTEVQRPVPLNKMIYIGDGPTDIPCFTIVNRAGGEVIGIRGKRKTIVPSMGINEIFKYEYRPRWGPFEHNYAMDSDLVLTIQDLLLDMLKRPD